MDDSAKSEGEAASAAMKASTEPSALDRAKANGYVEQPPLSLEERRATLLNNFEHAHKSNSPVTPRMMQELRDVMHPAAPAADDPSKQGGA